jgi:hypothetical protein
MFGLLLTWDKAEIFCQTFLKICRLCISIMPICLLYYDKKCTLPQQFLIALLQLASQSGYVTINWKKINKDMGKVSRNVTEKFEEYTSREQQSEVSKYFKKVRDPSIFGSTLTKLCQLVHIERVSQRKKI